MDWMELTVVEMKAALFSGTTSAVDIAEQLIARTQANTALNCYVQFDATSLLQQAALADQRIAAGERLPLLGIPIALKDNIQAVGFACGNGTAALHGHIARGDAALVSKLRKAGALITGKLGLHELALGCSSNNAVTGAIHNPWDQNRIPGGSSGGCGAATAARMVPATIGTDTGGSIRIPSALCGVVGFRPTVGRVSQVGLAPISTTRDTAGPIARSVADVSLLDGVMTGEPDRTLTVSVSDLRLGIPVHYFWDDVDPGVAATVQEALHRIEKAGATLVPVELPEVGKWNSAVSLVVALYEFVRDMSQYLDSQTDGVRLPDLIEHIGSPDVRAIAAPLLKGGAIAQDAYLQALQARRQLQAHYAEAYRKADVQALAFPTTPCTASLISEGETFTHNGHPCPVFGTFIHNTDPGSNASLPGLTLPVGLSNAMPVGLALDGPIYSDKRLLAIGAALEAVLPPPPRAPMAA